MVHWLTGGDEREEGRIVAAGTATRLLAAGVIRRFPEEEEVPGPFRVSRLLAGIEGGSGEGQGKRSRRRVGRRRALARVRGAV